MFNKTHKDALPKPSGNGPNGEKLFNVYGIGNLVGNVKMMIIKVGFIEEQHIKPTSNPVFLVNGNVFDCYSPETLKVGDIWATVAKKTEERASRNVVNLDGYKRSMDELYEQFKKYDIPTLDKLIIIKAGKITRLKL